jgi:DNA-directed RNA polymerase sigma subunit (sigma70/sigma32)
MPVINAQMPANTSRVYARPRKNSPVVQNASTIIRTPLTRPGLAKRIEQGDLAAKREMTERNLGLVHALAKPYRNCGVLFDDLVQEGAIGLIRAWRASTSAVESSSRASPRSSSGCLGGV